MDLQCIGDLSEVLRVGVQALAIHIQRGVESELGNLYEKVY